MIALSKILTVDLKQMSYILTSPKLSTRSTDHRLLLKKLKFYGISGKLFTWIKEFLRNRKEIIAVDGAHPEPADVTSGEPQGTVLGPLLFLLDINDLEEEVHYATAASFADDTRLSAVINYEDDTLMLQEDLNRVVKWATHNNMVLHEGKFEYLCYRTGDSKWLEEMPFTQSYMEYHRTRSETWELHYQPITIGQCTYIR